MNSPRIYADFHNADAHRRLRLNCRGTLDDINRRKVTLADGLTITVYSEDVEGEVVYSEEENIWTAVIGWDAIRKFDDAELSVGTDQEAS